MNYCKKCYQLLPRNVTSRICNECFPSSLKDSFLTARMAFGQFEEALSHVRVSNLGVTFIDDESEDCV